MTRLTIANGLNFLQAVSQQSTQVEARALSNVIPDSCLSLINLFSEAQLTANLEL